MESPPDCEVLTEEDLHERRTTREEHVRCLLWDIAGDQHRFDGRQVGDVTMAEMASEVNAMYYAVAHKAHELDKLLKKKDIYRYQPDP